MTMGRREVMDLLTAHGLRPSRALGQNFVADGNTVRRIARLADVGPDDHVIEIGAGLGALTLALAETGAHVTAVEVDRHLVPVLESVVAGRGVSVVHADARSVDWSALLAGAARWVLVANLPYNVATPLVLDLLEGVPAIERMLVMVQREVGERLAAGVGDDAYGAASVKAAYWATASVVGKVPATVFVPQPRVESALVSVVRRPTPAVDVPYDRFEPLVRAGFATRRKMLRRALAGVVAVDVLEAAGVDPSWRAEQLDVDAWGRLTACAMSAGPPPS
jgi:16S rRNA (adenine1518-N6/adenine1519-N6)-dimethyltransferase